MAKTNPFRFSTKYQDHETDLIYYGYRYCNATTARWLSRDPVGDPSFRFADTTPTIVHAEILRALFQEETDDGGADDHYSLTAAEGNLYGFLQNNPASSLDPTGTNIYLQRGNGKNTVIGRVHVSICVDAWHDDTKHKDCAMGKRCFTFGKDENSGWGMSAPHWSWLGWSEFNAGGPIKGSIYEEMYTDGRVESTLQTTILQDKLWLIYMDKTRKGLRDTYSIARHNCIRYVNYEFRDATLHMGGGLAR